MWNLLCSSSRLFSSKNPWVLAWFVHYLNLYVLSVQLLSVLTLHHWLLDVFTFKTLICSTSFLVALPFCVCVSFCGLTSAGSCSWRRRWRFLPESWHGEGCPEWPLEGSLPPGRHCTAQPNRTGTDEAPAEKWWKWQIIQTLVFDF